MGNSYLPPTIQAASGGCDPVALRAIFACFATGVTVVTANVGGSPVGMTVNSFSSTSLLPPLVLFCAANDSQTWPQIKSTGCFNVNILASDQGKLARRFASRDAPRFAGQTFFTPATGSPVLPGVLAYIDCVLCDTHPAGDHTIAVGQVVEAAKLRDGPPLVFFASTWGAHRPASRRRRLNWRGSHLARSLHLSDRRRVADVRVDDTGAVQTGGSAGKRPQMPIALL